MACGHVLTKRATRSCWPEGGRRLHQRFLLFQELVFSLVAKTFYANPFRLSAYNTHWILPLHKSIGFLIRDRIIRVVPFVGDNGFIGGVQFLRMLYWIGPMCLPLFIVRCFNILVYLLKWCVSISLQHLVLWVTVFQYLSI